MADQELSLKSAELAELREHARSLADNLAGPLRRVRVTSGDATIEVEWQRAGRATEAARSAPAQPPAAAEPAPAETIDARLLVTSPIVGTFYRAPEPGAAPFVDVGDSVLPGQTVAIVEAMKLFNPVTTDHAGVVAAVLVENGQPVEFGQPLLRLTQASLNGTNPAGGE